LRGGLFMTQQQPGVQVYTQGFGSSDISVAIPVYLDSAPSTNYGVNFPIGKRAIVQSTNAEYVLTSKTTLSGITTANWQIAAAPTGAVATETGDTGTAAPVAGNIKHAGTAGQITTAAAGSTVTYSLPAAITTPGSLTTTTTLVGGTGITATTGNITATTGNLVSTAGSVSAATTVTGGTGVTATTGNITASTGNLISTLGSVSAATTVTGGTGVTATTGNITASAGNIVLAGVATQFQMNGGAVTDFIGQATLITGAATVANTNIAAGDRIFVTRSSLNGSTALGELVTTIAPATSFAITSVSVADGSTTIVADTSIVDYVIIRQN